MALDVIVESPGTPTALEAHKTTHQNGGSDEINVAGLSGLLADPQTPLSHVHTWASITNKPETVGSSFPSSPSVGQLFFDTTSGFLCFWNGTYWLTAQEFQMEFARTSDMSAVGAYAPWIHVRKDYRVLCTKFGCNVYVQTTNNASNYYTIRARAYNVDLASYTNLASVNTSATALTRASVETGALAVPASLANNNFLVIWLEKTGSPGLLSCAATIQYRLIIE